MQIIYLTAGAAGMYCGSCLHDNALARALLQLGHDAILVPTYTPILTDEENVSSDRLFYGGLNVYLQQASPIFRWLPNWADQFLNSPKLVNWIASRAMGTSPASLGALTLSMLRGSAGRQKKEVQRLCAWLKTQTPQAVVFSNLLIAGCIAELKTQIDCPMVVVLQGDDIFFEGLDEPYRSKSMIELRKLAQHVDLFVVHSQDYGRRMQHMLGFPSERLSVNPLTIDTGDFVDFPFKLRQMPDRRPTIGYLARLAPEKGLHQLVEAFITLRQSGKIGDCRLAIAGWLGKQHASYWLQQQDRLSAAGLLEDCVQHGSVDRAGKLKFLESIDVLCVPTTSLEPKGLFVLEALATGVPYVQPKHGAFPEMHERFGGGYLYDPQTAGNLAACLADALSDLDSLRQTGLLGRQAVLSTATTQHEARRLVELISNLPKRVEKGSRAG